MSNRETWLNGWYRNGSTVLIGPGVHCAGCGRSFGVTCVAFSEGYVAPEKDPDWPFDEETCPLCATQAVDTKSPSLDERLAAFKAAKQRLGPQEQP